MLPYYKEIHRAGNFLSRPLYDKVLGTETEWTKYFNFTACSIDPEEFLLQDHFYHWLYQRHRYKAGVLCMESRTVYNWHQDTSRGVCVNSILYTPDTISCTYFREEPEVTHRVIDLQYTPGTRVLFNNQKEHMVVNHAGIRLMLTVEFEEDKDSLSFDNLLNEIEQEYTTDDNQ